mmetsp:Transcript_4579/g.9189  ORF Transcript_4579/g.9189 Transcript_4579/m.9189 type:complete len:81 (+) Transcript_4579:161-403(+)
MSGGIGSGKVSVPRGNECESGGESRMGRGLKPPYGIERCGLIGDTAGSFGLLMVGVEGFLGFSLGQTGFFDGRNLRSFFG